jgi:hypothetical protein
MYLTPSEVLLSLGRYGPRFEGFEESGTATPPQRPEALRPALLRMRIVGAPPSPSGSTLEYSTYLGGSGWEIAHDIAVDPSGAAYVAGRTDSTDFPTQDPFQAANQGADDAFVAKLSPAGSALLYATYLGGDGVDIARGIAVDSRGAAYVTGSTYFHRLPDAVPW